MFIGMATLHDHRLMETPDFCHGVEADQPVRDHLAYNRL